MPFSIHLGTISIPDIAWRKERWRGYCQAGSVLEHALTARVFLAYAGMNMRG
jgi:hypothetical protein